MTRCNALHPTLSIPCLLPQGHARERAPEHVGSLGAATAVRTLIGWSDEQKQKARPLPSEDLRRLRSLVRSFGFGTVACVSGVAYKTIIRARAGEPLQGFTRECLLNTLALPSERFARVAGRKRGSFAAAPEEAP